ncbi:hypothetical protein BS47DRAFT_1401296 [Hydnum rufescens UP504]|uniref:Uncharacterized protein n=1 Tax=Hydnum rufescens UP504 TaxID=1448309 RepID=A0A9P6AFR4_9AGAM|nr:hypothetical protein BS47DRAFT_1401296 [Hydnum rufescens UP504]
MGNSLTEQVIPPLDVSTTQQSSSSPCPRYITQRPTSTRIIALPSQTDPLGDTIAIFALETKLHLVRHVHTGLEQLHGVNLRDEHGQYVAAAGLAGGGIAVFERVDGGADLKLLARYDGVGSEKVPSFAWA